MRSLERNDVIAIDFNEVKNQSIQSIYSKLKTGISSIIVNDEEHGDFYEIRLQRSNLGIQGLCFLNNRPSYQADFTGIYKLELKTVINNIAGGEVIA